MGSVVAGSAGELAIARKKRLVEEALAQFDALDQQRVVARQVGNRGLAAHDKAKRRKGGWKIKRRDGRDSLGNRCSAKNLADLKRVCQVHPKRGRDWVAFARMCGQAITGWRNRARRVQQGGYVKIHHYPSAIVRCQ